MKITNRALVLPVFFGLNVFACSAGEEGATDDVADFNLTGSARGPTDLFGQGFEVTTSETCSPFGITTVEAAECQYKVFASGQPDIGIKNWEKSATKSCIAGPSRYRASTPHSTNK